MKSALFLSLSVLFASPSFAFTAWGNVDCGHWLKPTSPAQLQIQRAWLMGYLSGVNARQAADKPDTLSKLSSPEQAYVWMDKFCQKSPLEKTATGAKQLFKELAGKNE